MAKNDKNGEDSTVQPIRKDAAETFDVLIIDASGFLHVRNPLVLKELANELVTTDLVVEELRDSSIAMLEELQLNILSVNEDELERAARMARNQRLSKADLSLLVAIELRKRGRTGLLSDDVELIKTAKRLFNIQEVVVFLKPTRQRKR
ncbi:hypothetical protein GCM10007981_15620 [Thermocladium modestius]|uniref:PIN domain-containing protein n=1 Tax=Thermocladium modestius TaxID=62609 RepID=A0A830GV14_9CREN|nr:hypothetical protein [Thermocladium modestius]GGP21906.1 hypothetical protein GCM10007981_15620 [Thermocladium modestius]